MTAVLLIAGAWAVLWYATGSAVLALSLTAQGVLYGYVLTRLILRLRKGRP